MEGAMDSHPVFCPNPDCPARGQSGKGNIGIHSQKEQRYICHVCHKTFAETTGTAFYRLRTEQALVAQVVTLLAHGCPVAAIVAAFELDERTVYDWQTRAGQHCEAVHHHLVEQPRDLGQVQADELRVKKQGGIVWMALALQVQTRLWLGGVVSAQRDGRLIVALFELIRRSAVCRPVLFCVDGFRAYVSAIREVFREAIHERHQRGRPQWRPWDNILIGQVVKQYAQGHVIGVTRHVIQGTLAQIENVLKQTQQGGVINTAYIERLNATFRARLTSLVRRGRALARQTLTLQTGMYLIGTVYNFCTEHESARIPGVIGGHKWLPRTPAMAAGITDHCWTVHQLLLFQVPLSRWTPPVKRGRPSLATKRWVAQWS
jgi:transposase-like protein/IS1 family transposase